MLLLPPLCFPRTSVLLLLLLFSSRWWRSQLLERVPKNVFSSISWSLTLSINIEYLLMHDTKKTLDSIQSQRLQLSNWTWLEGYKIVHWGGCQSTMNSGPTWGYCPNFWARCPWKELGSQLWHGQLWFFWSHPTELRKIWSVLSFGIIWEGWVNPICCPREYRVKNVRKLSDI